MLKLNIELAVEIDDNATIADMRDEILHDVEAWLASAPIMAKLADVEDVLAPAKAQFATFKALEGGQS